MSVWEYMLSLIVHYPLSFVPDFFLLIGIIVGISVFRSLNQPLRVALLLLTLCFGIEVVLIYYAATGRNNHFLVTLMSLLEMVCLSLLYWLEITYKRSRWTIVCLLAVYIISFAFMFEWTRIADFVLGLERFILIVFVIMHLHFILNTMRVPNLLTHPMFWISSGVLIYATGTFFIFTFTKFTFGTSANIPSYWSIIQCFTALFYAMLAVAFYLSRREKVTHIL